MLVTLIILAVVVAIYVYAALGYYYTFKNWLPVCFGCTGPECSIKKKA